MRKKAKEKVRLCITHGLCRSVLIAVDFFEDSGLGVQRRKKEKGEYVRCLCGPLCSNVPMW